MQKKVPDNRFYWLREYYKDENTPIAELKKRYKAELEQDPDAVVQMWPTLGPPISEPRDNYHSLDRLAEVYHRLIKKWNENLPQKESETLKRRMNDLWVEMINAAEGEVSIVEEMIFGKSK